MIAFFRAISHQLYGNPKSRPNDRNISLQHIPTLLDHVETCCEGLAKCTQHHATIYAIFSEYLWPLSPVVLDVNMEYVHERFHRRRRKIVACSLVLLAEDDEREVKRGKTRLWIKRRHEKGYFANILYTWHKI